MILWVKVGGQPLLKGGERGMTRIFGSFPIEVSNSCSYFYIHFETISEEWTKIYESHNSTEYQLHSHQSSNSLKLFKTQTMSLCWLPLNKFSGRYSIFTANKLSQFSVVIFNVFFNSFFQHKYMNLYPWLTAEK